MTFVQLLTLPRRIVRYLFMVFGYDSALIWDKKYQQGYDLAAVQEDGRYGVLQGLIQRYQGQGPILDAGCGDGVIEERIRQFSNVRTLGIDYAPEAIKRAQSRSIPNCTFLCCDFRDFKSDERYTLILLNETLYCVDSPADTLRVLEHHLTDDGVFVISMFNTLVAPPFWRAIQPGYHLLQSILVRDENSGLSWRIRVLRPRSAGY
jgi:2-polyprenyl-3-methyl-5-hydroxy-6-metoxy-1,4-benzoquinol methylase